MSAACLGLRPRLSYEQHLHALLRIYNHTIAIRADRA
jgi:hypothetical protein